MAQTVRTAPKLQYADYWLMLPSWASPDGSLRFRGLFSFHNEHPIAVAKLLYWLNAKMFAGSNRSLALVVVAIVVAQVVVLAGLARRTDSLARWPKVAVIVTGSFLLFSRQGIWNFWLAMSGAAWLTANTFAFAALLAQVHRRRFVAMGLAAAASITYGTGLMAWPAIVVAGAIGDRSLKRRWPEALLGGTVLAGYYLVRPESASAIFGTPTMRMILEYTVMVLGGILSPHDAGRSKLIGAVILVAAVALVVASVLRRGVRGTAPWVGLLTYGLGSTVMISRGRAAWALALGPPSRYMSLSAVTIVAITALLLAHLPRRRATAALLVPLAIVVGLGGSDSVAEVRESTVTQEHDAILFRLDLIDGRDMGLAKIPAVHDRVEAMHHYPFRGFDLGCDRFGDRLPDTAIIEPTEQTGLVTFKAPFSGPNSALGLSGWIAAGGRQIECIVVVDRANRVVGLGSSGTAGQGYQTPLDAPDGAVAFKAITPVDTEAPRILVRFVGQEPFTSLAANPR